MGLTDRRAAINEAMKKKDEKKYKTVRVYDEDNDELLFYSQVLDKGRIADIFHQVMVNYRESELSDDEKNVMTQMMKLKQAKKEG